MNGGIAQIVALTCYGNAFFQGKYSAKIFPDNSNFMYCDKVTFVTVQRNFIGQKKETVVAQTPDDWFKYLKNHGANKLCLSRDQKFSARMKAGLAGCGQIWSIEVQYPNNKCETWIARWDVWNNKAPKNKIWRVTYGCMAKGTTGKTKQADLSSIKRDFSKSLQEIRDFSSRHEYFNRFTNCFASAIETIESDGKNRHAYHNDLAPKGFLSAEAETLLDACQKSWVFGGMGSWNDGFPAGDQKEYGRVSSQLYEIINEAIIAGANDQKEPGAVR